MATEVRTQKAKVRTKRIDGDTHFNLTLDFKELQDLLPRTRLREAQDMMWRDGERFANPGGVRVEVGGRTTGFGSSAAAGVIEGDPSYDPDARVKQIEKLGFDMSMLICNSAMPAPLRPADKPLWLRTALAKLYNNASAKLQATHPDRFICHATIPWDDIDGSIEELERASKLGLKTVLIAGSYMDRNLDV